MPPTSDPSARTPRVSILIPNYNNGVESSKSGKDNLILSLLQSLSATLKEDPTPFEVIAYDDGSTDDSLQTLRDWSQKTWPDGRPFLELIEAEHCGVLAHTANIMSERARGEFLARLDGDVVCLTPQWVSLLCEIFDTGPQRLGVVGPKQLKPDGRIHSFGDWILHPKGYHHVASGLERHAVRHPMEVDHVMGCFYCHRKEVWEEIGGYDEDFLRGQTIDFGLRARLAGWSCIAVPHIEFIHAHTLRKARATTADSEGGIDDAIATFHRKWGFSRVSADLDDVRAIYRGTPLLWNARWFGPGDQASRSLSAPPLEAPKVEQSDWQRYTQDEAFRNVVNLRTAVAGQVIQQFFTGDDRPDRVVQIGSGEGLVAHLLAMKGLTVTATDSRRPLVEMSRTVVASQKYPNEKPRFKLQEDPDRLPIDDNASDLTLLFDCLELERNPTQLLREVWRITKVERPVLVISRRLGNRLEHADDHAHFYQWWELISQFNSVGGFYPLVEPGQDRQGADMVYAAKTIKRVPDWFDRWDRDIVPPVRETMGMVSREADVTR